MDICTREDKKGVAWPRRRWGGGAVAETESGARWPSGLERWLALATGRCGSGSNPTAENFGTLAIPFTPFRSVGPFYLVSMLGEVKSPTSPHWNV